MEFREYTPWIPPSDWGDCHGFRLSRHFRVVNYDIRFREPHLQIARDDGAVIADRKNITVGGDPADCGKPVRSFIRTVGVDDLRRAMFVEVGRCNPDTRKCKYVPTEWLFFRLPKPAK